MWFADLKNIKVTIKTVKHNNLQSYMNKKKKIKKTRTTYIIS